MVKKHWVLWLNLLLLLLLLAKNPFSARTLIPNFEPYPDTIHYIVPARSLVQGGEFAINREGRSMKPGVPPLYSLFLVPFFIVNNDPRFFYIANVLLSLGGLILLYAILRKCTQNALLLFISLFLYVTNYLIYWYPSLAMAENLTLFLFLLNVYLMTIPVNKITLILAGIIPFCFFLTKYANAPLTFVFLLMFGIKILFEFKKAKNNTLKNNFLLFGGSIVGVLSVLFLTETLPSLSTLVALFTNLLPHMTNKARVSSSGGWFALSYMKDYLPKYIRSLFGSYPIRFLWDDTPIWPLFVATPGVIGLFLALFVKKIRIISLALILNLFLSILFISTFYSIDMRYLYHAIPTLLIGFVIFWDTALSFRLRWRNHLSINVIRYGLPVILLILFLFYCASNAIRLKKQVMLNLKYAETPWYYLSVVKLNEYFKEYPKEKKAPVVISSMIPYYIDFYSNGIYTLLPMSKVQEFRGFKEEAWGKFDYSDLMLLYSKILYSGHEVYVDNYGIGNEKPLQDDFQKIQDNFILTQVADGCYGACNIWQLKIKYPLKRMEEIQ